MGKSKVAPRVVFVAGEQEWDGVYVDGEVVDQNSTLCASAILESVLDKLGITFEYRGVRDSWQERYGNYPEKLESIPKKAYRKTGVSH